MTGMQLPYYPARNRQDPVFPQQFGGSCRPQRFNTIEEQPYAHGLPIDVQAPALGLINSASAGPIEPAVHQGQYKMPKTPIFWTVEDKPFQVSTHGDQSAPARLVTLQNPRDQQFMEHQPDGCSATLLPSEQQFPNSLNNGGNESLLNSLPLERINWCYLKNKLI